MKLPLTIQGRYEQGKIGWAILWLLGVPLPVLLLIYFFTHG